MINAFQHVGQGVWNATRTYDFYKRFFGYKVKLNDLTTLDKDMAPVVGSTETLRSLMAMNVKGGGILELIEHRSSAIRPYPANGGYGNYGILEVGYGVRCIERVVAEFVSQGVKFLSPIREISLLDGGRWRYAYLQDPDGLRIQLVEDLRSRMPITRKPEVRGVILVGIGVSNRERSKQFYGSVLGFDTVLYESENHGEEMGCIGQSPSPIKVSILSRSAPVSAAVDTLPAGTITLYEVPGYPGEHIYKGRRWGDIGCMEFCMDVSELQTTIDEIKTRGIDVYLPPVEVDMGSGSKGMVAYIRDPDGTIIELVEVRTVAWVSASLFMRVVMPFLKLYDRLI